MDLHHLDTEQRNPDSAHIDRLTTLEIVQRINEEDHRCAEAVSRILPDIARCADLIYERVHAGGRLFYCGAGTSGRLGILDASECPPTYGVDEDTVIGLIAGGPSALIRAVEGAEDSPALGRADLIARHFNARDILVGIAASGRTPYVLGAMDYARETGAPVLALVCTRGSEMAGHADITMEAVPGPEVIAGSTRMKSGTCQKMIPNILSTTVMIRLGKVYGNLMVDVKATNRKLQHRAVSIVASASGCSESEAAAVLEKCRYACKPAILMQLLGISETEALQLLRKADGHVDAALKAGGR